MAYVLGRYASPGDYWRARESFRGLCIANPRPGENWHIGLVDHWHWLEDVVERPPHELRYWGASTGGSLLPWRKVIRASAIRWSIRGSIP